MSSGLTYPPGMYADTDELVALCRVVADAGGYYAPHHRSYGRGALAAYAEMIMVARRSGCAAAPDPRDHELRRERRPGRRAAWS